MITAPNNVFACAANFLRGRKCPFCGSFKVYKTARNYVHCKLCTKSKSLSKLRREIEIIKGFYRQQPGYRLAKDLGVDLKVVTRVYQKLREAIYHLAELEGGKLKDEIELDETYFGGKRKSKRGRGADGKSVVFGLERDGRVYTQIVETLTAEELMSHIRSKTRKGSSYAKHILYNYRGVSKYHFPMYLKEIEYRFNHRRENIFKDFVKIYFGYIAP